MAEKIAVGVVVGGALTYLLTRPPGTADPRLEAQLARLTFFVPKTQQYMTKKKLMVPTYKQWTYIGATWGFTTPDTEVAVAENDIIVDLGIDLQTNEASMSVSKLGADATEMRVDGNLVYTFPESTGLGAEDGTVFRMVLPPVPIPLAPRRFSTPTGFRQRLSR